MKANNEFEALVRALIEEIDISEIKDQTSACVVAWFCQNATLNRCDMEAMGIYHYHMQQFWQKVEGILLLNELATNQSNARANQS